MQKAGFIKAYGRRKLAYIDEMTANPALWREIVAGREKEAARSPKPDAKVAKALPKTVRVMRLSGASTSSPSRSSRKRREAAAKAPRRAPARAARAQGEKVRRAAKRAARASSSSSSARRATSSSSSSAPRAGVMLAVRGLPVEMAGGVVVDPRYRQKIKVRAARAGKKARRRGIALGGAVGAGPLGGVAGAVRAGEGPRGGVGAGGAVAVRGPLEASASFSGDAAIGGDDLFSGGVAAGAGLGPVRGGIALRAQGMKKKRPAAASKKKLAKKLPKEAAFGVLAEKMRAKKGGKGAKGAKAKKAKKASPKRGGR